jgi:hypothetical protein
MVNYPLQHAPVKDVFILSPSILFAPSITLKPVRRFDKRNIYLELECFGVYEILNVPCAGSKKIINYN